MHLSPISASRRAEPGVYGRTYALYTPRRRLFRAAQTPPFCAARLVPWDLVLPIWKSKPATYIHSTSEVITRFAPFVTNEGPDLALSVAIRVESSSLEHLA